MAKPTVIPEWATTIGTDINGQPTVITPNESKRITGWAFKEKPPYQFMNWLFRTIWQWIVWIDDELDGRVTTNTNDIGALDGRLDTAESDITALEGRTDDIETELLSVATLKNSIDYSKIIGELFTLDFPKTPSFTFNPASPRAYFPAVNLTEIDVTITVDNTDVPQAFLGHLRSVYLIYLPGKSGEVFQWAVTVSGSDITFPNTTSANAMLAALFEDKEVQGTFTNGRTVNVDDDDFAITNINLVTRVVTVSGSPTTGSQTAQFFHHRIAGSSTTARLFEVSGESYIATGDPDGYFIGGLRTRGYFQGHWHQLYTSNIDRSFDNVITPGVGNWASYGGNTIAISDTGIYLKEPRTDGANGPPRTRKTTHSPGYSGIPYQWCGA